MKLTCLWILFCLPLLANAQSNGARYRVEFTDKAGSVYDIPHPEAFLSERALSRRNRYHIPVDENDLPVSSVYLDSLKRHGFKVLYTSRWFNFATVAVVSPEDTAGVSKWNFVRSIKLTRPDNMLKNAIKKWSEIKTPATKSIQTEADDSYGYSSEQIAQLNGKVLHENGFKGQGMVIAILDAGFRAANQLAVFDSLFLQDRMLGIRDFVNPESNVFEEYQHGMNVLSLMGANTPGKLVGTAPDASYFLIRTEDENSEYPVEMDNYIAGLELADSIGADVINASLGYFYFDDPADNLNYDELDGKTLMITQAVETAEQKGMIVCVSAGNEGDNAWQHIIAPVDANGVLSMAAVNIAGERAPFSSTGPSADGRIKPEVAACGWDTWIQKYPDEIGVSNGTSFSSPLVAGLTACLWQEYPDKSPAEIVDAIIQSASQYASPDNYLGYGVPDFGKASLLLQETLADGDSEKQWKVSPNPFDENIRLEYQGNGLLDDASATFILISSTGTILKEERLSGRVELVNNLGALPSGLYFLQVITNGTTENHKLIKR
ncbi:serine protease [Prolixibacter bellariivorans]|uniref:Serine protease n=1 Tax=Prolixibacter bellariivorans TaxID=314319 RepID=A0A5M4AW66_9BACT|nr:S8 family serine peptidase [Prolixibacter bellariivorans]GET32170.1 serine protease [Prolixibacter bellariivorans]